MLEKIATNEAIFELSQLGRPEARAWVATAAVLTAIALAFATIVGYFATPYMGAATFAFGLLCIGLTAIITRQNVAIHVGYMNLGILIDLGIVLALEMQRSAIATAVSLSLTPLQQAHVGCSSVATLLYIPVLVLGWLRYSGKPARGVHTWHFRLGLTAFVFRALGFVLMFALLDQANS